MQRELQTVTQTSYSRRLYNFFNANSMSKPKELERESLFCQESFLVIIYVPHKLSLTEL